ncbi:hypothetical protein [Actinomadura oligospora]|uniref:hypothetical protein n=1 Tax=Actinomadura oligospora TaxID=111804 RepID=UPI001FE166C1|nr:hypothetical protein [Actinomadura oligospora]
MALVGMGIAAAKHRTSRLPKRHLVLAVVTALAIGVLLIASRAVPDARSAAPGPSSGSSGVGHW